jgi:signal transduction histidine kinase
VDEAALNTWERRLARLAHLISYFVLTVTTVLYLSFTQQSPGQQAVTLAIVAFGYVWFTLRNVLPLPVFMTGMILFYAVLGLREHWFGAVSYAVYVYAGEYLHGKWMFIVTAVTAVFATLSLFGGYPGPETRLAFWGLLALFVTIACIFTFIGHVTTEQARKRKELLEENRGLHAQLMVQAHEAGVLDERQRLAQEIHDTLAQGFTGIITQLEAAESTGDWKHRVEIAARLARENLAEARRSVNALRPAQLENAGLADALGEVVDGWSKANDVAVQVTTTGQPRPMHPEVEVALLRTAQEALANVAKHASASRVGLTLSYMEDVVTLDVRDDGIGFDSAKPKDGFGLTTMRQRVQRLAGALAIESAPGEGTAISASVPAVAP